MYFCLEDQRNFNILSPHRIVMNIVGNEGEYANNNRVGPCVIVVIVSLSCPINVLRVEHSGVDAEIIDSVFGIPGKYILSVV